MIIRPRAEEEIVPFPLQVHHRRTMSSAPPPSSERIGAEAVGRARDFRRRVMTDDTAFITVMERLVEPVRVRLKRYPNRKLRRELLIDLERQWRCGVPTRFRLSYSAKLDSGWGEIAERRVTAGQTRRINDPEWRGLEDDVSIVETQLLAMPGRFRLHSTTLCTFSQHAVARRLQRGVGIDDEALITDLAVVAAIDVDQVPADEGFKIVTDRHGSSWRGRVAKQQEQDGTITRMISVRTWLPA
jgi:hypothetical protein